MDPWISPTIPYPVSPLDRGSGMAPTFADGNATPTAITRYQRHIQHLLDYTYRKSSLGKNPTSAQRLVEQNYRKTSSGNFSRTTRTIQAARAAKTHYNTPAFGNLSRTARIIQAAGFGPH
jgi:hypothetical protein